MKATFRIEQRFPLNMWMHVEDLPQMDTLESTIALLQDHGPYLVQPDRFRVVKTTREVVFP